MIKSGSMAFTIDSNLESYFMILYGMRPARYLEMEQIMETDEILYPKLKTFIKEKKINEAEDLLFEYTDPENQVVLRTGLLFYYLVNRLSDEELKESDYDREEIMDGIEELLEIYEIEE